VCVWKVQVMYIYKKEKDKTNSYHMIFFIVNNFPKMNKKHET
jgi:hypothetical protein